MSVRFVADEPSNCQCGWDMTYGGTFYISITISLVISDGLWHIPLYLMDISYMYVYVCGINNELDVRISTENSVSVLCI